MNVYIIGNSLIPEDSAPVRLLPDLRSRFPQVSFIEADPNENFIPEDGSIIIDTVKGITAPQWFTDIIQFEQTRSVSPHDYDLVLHIRLLLKLKKITRIRILGIPAEGSPENVFRMLRTYLSAE